MHIGVGSFHKAHQAVYTDDILSIEPSWGIIGASLKSTRAADQLNPQSGLYTLTTVSSGTAQHRLIGAIQHVISAGDAGGRDALAEAIADPQIHIITVTATEKGYCARDGQLDRDDPDVAADLTDPSPRRSLPGVLTSSLARRAAGSAAPITVISCDNLQHNGKVLEQVVTEFFEARYPAHQEWLTSQVTFPCTMVDRIVPQVTAGDLARITDDLGYRDEGAVVSEPFSQWVIEDRFAGPRPPWDQAGATFADDVSTYETAKLRLLNGPHSACAYLGILSGYDAVHEVVADPELRTFLEALVEHEIMPTVTPPPGTDLSSYARSIFERFANHDIVYRTRQVGADGTQKLPQRLIPVVQARLDARQPVDRLALVIAAWIEHLRDPAPDPAAERLQGLHQQHGNEPELVCAVAAETGVFDALGDDARFERAVAHALQRIRTEGLPRALSF